MWLTELIDLSKLVPWAVALPAKPSWWVWPSDQAEGANCCDLVVLRLLDFIVFYFGEVAKVRGRVSRI